MSNHSRLFEVAVIAGVVLFTLVLAMSANATIVASRTDHLIGYGTVNDVLLNCTVDLDAGIYTYSYQLQYLTGSGTVNLFNVENPDDAAYTNAWNSGDFWNHLFVDLDDAYSVQWDNGTFVAGQTRNFSYKSIYGYREIPVYAYVGAGDIADGETYGMSGAAVPEPSSLAGLALAGFAMIPALRRRRKYSLL